MSDETDQANDRARFAAREFVARFERELGVDLSEVIRDRMLFAFEIGYLRGHGEGMQHAVKTYTKELP